MFALDELQTASVCFAVIQAGRAAVGIEPRSLGGVVRDVKGIDLLRGEGAGAR